LKGNDEFQRIKILSLKFEQTNKCRRNEKPFTETAEQIGQEIGRNIFKTLDFLENLFHVKSKEYVFFTNNTEEF